MGQAFHAGVLASLEQDLGWDPRTAEVIVGTSAGSITGAALRLGVAASDMAAFALDEPLSPSGEAFFAGIGAANGELPAPPAADFLRGWRLPTPALLARSVRRPWTLRPAAIASTLLPPGQYDLLERTQVLDAFGDEWPEGLWLCAARRDNARRVVFGRPGAPSARLSEAVAASCAIPGYFAPVTIGTREYLDGGVHSPTNADVLARSELDLVIVVAPMSSAHGSVRSADGAIRWASHRRLDSEIRRLRSRGTEVVRFEPSASTLKVMGVNAMAEDRSANVVRAARQGAAAHASAGRSASRLAALAGSRSQHSGVA